MNPFTFRPVEPDDDQFPPEDRGPQGCTCPDSDNQYLMYIEEGGIYLKHEGCGKPPPDSWGDWQELVEMPEFRARVTWEKQCSCRSWDQLSCDCGPWLEVEFIGKV